MSKFAPWRGQTTTPSSSPSPLAERAVVGEQRSSIARARRRCCRRRPRVTRPHDLHRPRRQLVERSRVEARPRASGSRCRRRPPTPPGSGVPLARCRATFSAPRPSRRALEPDRRQRDADLLEQLLLRDGCDLSGQRPRPSPVSIDVAACEIAQPRPENLTSWIVSPRRRRRRWSPRRRRAGSEPSACASACSSVPCPRGFL